MDGPLTPGDPQDQVVLERGKLVLHGCGGGGVDVLVEVVSGDL